MLFGRVVGICAFFPFLGNPLLTYFRFLFGAVRPFALWFYTYTSSINTNYIYFFRKERGSASYVNGCITSGGVLRAVKTHSIFLYLEIRVFEDIFIIFYLILSGYLGTAVKGPHCSWSIVSAQCSSDTTPLDPSGPECLEGSKSAKIRVVIVAEILYM